MSLKNSIGKLFGKKSEAESDAKSDAVDVKPEANIGIVQPTAGVEVETEIKPVTTEGSVVLAEKPVIPPPTESTIYIGDGKIETIALGQDELDSLAKNRYEEIKDRFPRTFLIEKAFWMRSETMDITNPRKVVKVKRAAEIRAASLMHALKLIGWDDKNVELVRETSDYSGDITVIVDGKDVCKVKVPPTADGKPFTSLGGGKRKEYVKAVVDVAVADDKVKAILASGRVVSGWSFEPEKHIRISTSKAPRETLVGIVVPKPFPLPDPAQVKAAEEVRAQEDKAVFDAINGASVEASSSPTSGECLGEKVEVANANQGA